ncbi:MAG: glycosyltransferase family 39 protein [Dehalococcoidia bacterium]|nr:glycosyltransferase family 39 protein [Dehalococcoidia bacterium]
MATATARPGERVRLLGRLGVRFFQPVPLALGGVLLLGLVLRLVFYYGVVRVDPFAYSDAAVSIARWQPVFDPDVVGRLYYTQYIRLSLVVPAAALYWLFGPSDAASTAVPIAVSLATALVAYRLGRRAGSALGGVLAAFLVAVFPVAVANSTEFLPDTMMMFFASLAMLLFLEAFEDDLGRRGRLLRYGGAGMAWACCFYARPTAVALLMPFALLVILRRRIHLELGAAVAGGALVILAGNALLMSLGSEPLQDIRVILTEGRGSAPGALQYTDLDWTYLKDLARDPMFFPFTVVAATGLLLLIAQERHSWWKGRSFHLAVLAGGQYVYFEFLMRLPGLYSWWKEPRYILSMMVPLLVLGGVGLARWVEDAPASLKRATAAYVSGALLLALVSSVWVVRNDHAYARANRVDALAVSAAAYLRTQPDLPVFTWNDDFARRLSYRLGLDDASYYDRTHDRGRVRNRFDAEGWSLVVPDSYVVLLQGDDDWTKPTAPGRSWQVVWDAPGQAVVYRVPAEPPPPAPARTEPAAVPLPGGRALVAVTASNRPMLPGEEVALGLEFASLDGTPASLRFQTQCESAFGPVRERVVPEGRASLTVALPLDARPSPAPQHCTVGLLDVRGAWRGLATFTVPSVATDEPETRYTVDRAAEQEHGWYATFQPFFSAGGSVVAVPPLRPLAVPLASLPAGSYRVALSVYDYGQAGENVVEVDLNGVRALLRWGGQAGPAHVVQLEARLADVPPGGSLVVTPLAAGQDAIVIDRVAVVGE